MLYNMYTPPTSNRPKRSLSHHSPHQTREPQSKKPKLGEDPARSVSPPHYLDSLSKIWLTREALRELNRRTQQIRSPQNLPTARRPLTRALRSELRNRLYSTRTPASDFLQHCTSEHLRELKWFAKLGGPDLVDLRGYPEPAQPTLSMTNSTQPSRPQQRAKQGPTSSSRSRPTATNSKVTKVTKSSGSYDANFHQRMIDNGIYPHNYEFPDGRFPPKPDNWEQIKRMLEERRRSTSPSVFSEEDYERFTIADDRVNSENKALQKVIPRIQGTIRDELCVDGPDIRLANLANLLNGKDHKAKPDIWYGARPEQIDPRIRDNEELGTYIVPTTSGSRPCAPNFFVEAKGPRGSDLVLSDQACFDGALGARGIHKLQTYEQQVPTYDHKAYTISTTYHEGHLKMYAHHLDQPNGPGTDVVYYMKRLKCWSLIGDRRNLLEGMTAFRNAEEWTKAQRDAAIEHANVVADNLITDGEGNDDREDELTADVAADSIVNSLASQSPFSAQMTTGTTRPDSSTSSDMIGEEFRPSRLAK